jgi:hypothetical protein
MIKASKLFVYVPSAPTNQIVFNCHFTKNDEVLVADITKTASFVAAETNANANPFVQGGPYQVSEMKTWAQANSYSMEEDGVNIGMPVLVSAVENGSQDIITLTFDKLIDKVGNAAALKAALTVSTDGGATYSPLALADLVSTVNGTTKTIVVTLDTAFTPGSFQIKLDANAIKDSLGQKNLEIVSIF